MKKTLLALFLAFTGATFAQKDYGFIYNTDSIINTGVRYHDAGKYDEAIRQYDKIYRTDPQYLRTQYEKAMSLSAAEKKDELKKHYETLYANGQMKDFPSLYTLYGSFLSDAKEYDAAEKIFLEGEPYQPDSSNFLYNMGILYARKKDSQKALDLFKKVVTLNPNHASSHYLIGITALENGKIVEGTLALISYLIIAPDGRFASDAIIKLNAKFGQNYLEKSKIVFSETGDNFEELETILRNQLPLKNAYKVKSEFDDVAIRQVQAVMEYSAEHKAGTGFFENTYMPWTADLIKKNQFEGFSYYMLLSMEQALGKKLTSQKKKITAFFDNYMAKGFWQVYAKRNVEHFGQKQDVVVTLQNNVQHMSGPKVDGKNNGRFKMVNDYGNLTGELNYKDDMQDGLQKYFDGKGNLIQEINFAADKKDGVNKEFYTNGNPELTQNFKNDMLEGQSITYYLNGGKQCELNYANGERDGNQVCYYANGKKKSELNYKAGKANGIYTAYNESGDLTAKYTYVDDELEGDYAEYYDGKTLKAEGKYSKGTPVGAYTTYFPNKSKNTEAVYANEKMAKFTYYFPNGKVSSETLYNDKGEIDTYTYFDWNGNKYFEEKYKGGELKSGIQYTKDKPAGTPVNIAKKPFVMLDYDGAVTVKGDFEKGVKNKEWQYFYSTDNLRIKENYSKGIQQGVRYDYNKNGTLYTICNYANDEINGIYENYDNDVLSQTVYYSGNKQNGPYETYYPDGKIASEGFVENNKVNYIQKSYWQNGKPLRKSRYIQGELSSVEHFNIDGTKASEFDYKNKNGKQTTGFYNGVTAVVIEYANGERNGKYLYKDKFNKPLIEGDYVNGEETNVYKTYSPSEFLSFEVPYYNGKMNGLSKKYDLAGNLRITEDNVFGEEYGMLQRFYQNKKKMYEFSRFDGKTDGEMKYYNLSGEHILTLVYEYGLLKQYVKKNAAGEVSEKVAIKNETADISSNYPNGKTAISIKFVKGNMEGKLAINNMEGKPEYVADYAKNIFNGERTEYYANGKIYKKEHLVNGDYDGKQEYFREDGKPWITANYKNAELHGDFLVYANGGALSFTKKYDSDELLAIIK